MSVLLTADSCRLINDKVSLMPDYSLVRFLS